MNVTDVMKTPQFWLLFGTSTLLCTGGMGLMSVVKLIIQNMLTHTMSLLTTLVLIEDLCHIRLEDGTVSVNAI